MAMFLSENEEDTMSLAAKIARESSKDAVYTLTGEMAAGKTKFAQGFAKGLSIDDYVTSPTFNLHNIYKFKGGELHHFDLYRLKSEEEALDLGIDEYFKMENTICLIEWPEIIKDLLPRRAINISIDKLTENKRKITIDKEHRSNLYIDKALNLRL